MKESYYIWNVEKWQQQTFHHSKPARKHTLLYGLFDSKWTIIYEMNIMLYWRRRETRDGDHKLLFTMFTEGIKREVKSFPHTLLYNQRSLHWLHSTELEVADWYKSRKCPHRDLLASTNMYFFLLSYYHGSCFCFFVVVFLKTAESQSQGDSLNHLSPADNVSEDPRCRKRQWRLMDGESGLYDTSPAGDPEFRASAVAKKRKKGKASMQISPLWLSGGERQGTGSWWMWAVTEMQRQTASVPERCSSSSITTAHPPPPAAVLRGGLQAERAPEPDATVQTHFRKMFRLSSAKKYPLTLWARGCSNNLQLGYIYIYKYLYYYNNNNNNSFHFYRTLPSKNLRVPHI